MIKQINVQALAGTVSGTSIVFIFSAAGCNGNKLVADVSLNDASVVYPFEPGMALPPSGQLSIAYSGPARAIRVHVLGYRVPGADAPATPVLVCSSAKGACGG